MQQEFSLLGMAIELFSPGLLRHLSFALRCVDILRSVLSIVDGFYSERYFDFISTAPLKLPSELV